MLGEDAQKAQEILSLSDQPTAVDTLPHGTNHKLPLDSSATKNFMSKKYYLRNKSLHDVSKSSSKTKVIQVGNGASMNIVIIIPIIIIIQGHMFKIDMMVFETHDNVNLVLCVINFVTLEAEISLV